MVSTSQTEFVKPEFSEPGAPLALDGARHPLLEQRTTSVVANQTFLSEVGTMCIITGATPSPHRASCSGRDFQMSVSPVKWKESEE